MATFVATELNLGFLHTITTLEDQLEKTSLNWLAAITGTRQTQPATLLVKAFGRRTPMLQMYERFNTQ